MSFDCQLLLLGAYVEGVVVVMVVVVSSPTRGLEEGLASIVGGWCEGGFGMGRADEPDFVGP